MQLISKENKGIRYLLSAIDIFSKYAWVIPLRDIKRITIVDAFQKFWKVQIKNQTKYLLIKEVNFTTVL